ncbi:1-deoxy-D-xylulose-5-phosphate reductoisomerase [Orrella marina]|uniref:1-deoxy-D-xylulose 5-phosphate reductoisomerase n=1 Tax=Orrella marina TaxID=2163011 RepID=A0A2R4XHL0_9BURK|nr:1-deoxy-D-xylulose-5-phosphate reductoisomerase [Orrella marina]AWB33224.1 1-deoxy-D-xylulose-5-phosphate reductoisomerase [Orrella marina]
MTPQSICILGATGSIGLSTIDVALRHPDRFRIVTLTARQRMDELAELIRRTGARRVVVPDAAAAQRVREGLTGHTGKVEILQGDQALADVASDDHTDVVMAAIVGAAGLPAALAAAQTGKRVLLANKEALVAAGSIFMKAVRESGAVLLPIDSEHNAIFQCMPGGGQGSIGNGPAKGVNRIVLTASGGPFRTHNPDEMAHITPEQACAHPNWSMGRKISVDSATMVNKGLEVIEAHWLFDMTPDRIDVVIHPQSIVHSLVEYDDGSMLAQLGNPDMRTPIAHALGFPQRIEAGVDWLDLLKVGRLDFEEVNLLRYPCLDLAYQALRGGQGACIAFNAANEVAVEEFLQRRIPYPGIAAILEQALNWYSARSNVPVVSIEQVLELDAQARTFALAACQSRAA